MNECLDSLQVQEINDIIRHTIGKVRKMAAQDREAEALLVEMQKDPYDDYDSDEIDFPHTFSDTQNASSSDTDTSDSDLQMLDWSMHTLANLKIIIILNFYFRTVTNL